MSERYDKLERQVGILAYASSKNKGFAAVLKARYSDFIVHEVGLDSKVAYLESLKDNLLKGEEIIEQELSNVGNKRLNNTVATDASTKDKENSPVRKKLKREENDGKDNNDTVSKNNDGKEDNTSVDNYSLLEQARAKLFLLVGESANGAIEFLKKNQKTTTALINSKDIHDNKKYFSLPRIEDKEKRKSIHMLIRSDLLKKEAVADTDDKKIRIWHKSFEKEMPNYGKFGSGNGKRSSEQKILWPKDRPEYLRFVLYKENIDTGTAAKDIARIARLSPKGHTHNRGGSGGMGYAGMKDKRGVTTQFCTIFKKTPSDLMSINKKTNNIGGGHKSRKGCSLMRVGHFAYVDRNISLGFLSGNRFEIVLRNVCIKEEISNTRELTGMERIALTKQTLERAADTMREVGFINYFGMQRFGKFHDTHKVGIAVLKGDFELACNIIMRVKPGENERQESARKKWEKRFDGINMQKDCEVRDAEARCAKDVLRDFGRFMLCETSILNSLLRRPLDYKKAFTSITKHMRSMFLHGYQSYLWNRAASQRIQEGEGTCLEVGDLVLTKDGNNDKSGSGLRGKEVKVVTKEDITSGKYAIEDVVLPLVGKKIVYPTNSTGGLFESMLSEDDLSKESFVKVGDRELSLGGDYRKLICKPSDVDTAIKVYKDPLQPLIQTDLMKLNNIPLECDDLNDECNGGKLVKHDSDSEAIIGMVIAFTLPPSAYATIALRELMKRPTSSEYQSELLLEGDCEADLGRVRA